MGFNMVLSFKPTYNKTNKLVVIYKLILHAVTDTLSFVNKTWKGNIVLQIIGFTIPVNGSTTLLQGKP